MNAKDISKNVEIPIGEFSNESRPTEIILGNEGRTQRSGNMLQVEVPARNGLVVKL